MTKTPKSVPKSSDPFYAREQKKYKRPIASREHILSLLRVKELPCSFLYLLKDLKLDPVVDDKSLSYRLSAMLRDKQIIERNGYYCLPGTTTKSAKGYVKFDYGADIFFIHKYKYKHLATSYRKLLFDGDYIEGELLGYYSHNKDPLWRVKKILRRAKKSLWGYYRLNEAMGGAYIEILNREKYGPAVMLPTSKKLAKQLLPEALVEVDIVIYPTELNPAVVQLQRIVSAALDYATTHERFLQIVAHKYSLTLTPPEALEDPLPEVQAADYAQRVNLCDKTFITIDSASTQDVDDAVYVESLGNSEHTLYVAIADVAHYVRPGTKLDGIAQRHMTSIYLPHTTFHMLPPELSTNLCSLIPHKVRLAMVCEMQVNKRGEITKSSVYEAAIKSAGAITYNEIDQSLAKKLKLSAKLQAQVNLLHQVYKKMQVQLNKQGKLAFQRSESNLVFNERQEPLDIHMSTATVSNAMIEVFMVSANQQVAKYMQTHKLPCIYRSNLPPSTDKLDSLKRILGDLGLKHSSLRAQPKSYQNFLRNHERHPEKELIHLAFIKHLQPARYTTECLGHFGLGLREYSHFTSPIRRYADLMLHQILKNHLHATRQVSQEYTSYIAKMCSLKSSYVDWASRDLVRFNVYSLLKLQNIEEVEGSFLYEKDAKCYFQLTDYQVDGWITYEELAVAPKELSFGRKLRFKIEAVYPEKCQLKLKPK